MTGTIIARTGKEITKTPLKNYIREDVEKACLLAGLHSSFRGTDEEGTCWTYDDVDGWRTWDVAEAPTAISKGIGNMALSELSQILQSKGGKIGMTRSRGIWVFIIGRNEYKGKTFLEVLTKALWDA